MRPGANELGRCKGRLRVNSRPWEQPVRESAPGQAGQLGPHSGARPAGQPPAGASRQACGCPGRHTHPPPRLPPASGREREGSSCGLVPGADAVTAVCSPGAQSAGAFCELGFDNGPHLPGLKNIQLFPNAAAGITPRGWSSRCRGHSSFCRPAPPSSHSGPGRRTGHG